MKIEFCTLHNADCMDGLRQFDDNDFDLAIVDPPYFEDYGKEIYPGADISTTGIKRNRFKSDHWTVPTHEYFEELCRVSKHQIIWGINYYDICNLGSGRIIWDKKNDSSRFSKCEIAYCSLHRRTEIFRYRWNGMLQENMANKEKRIHPTQKPVALYRWILNKYAKEGDEILDTHVGSGSIMCACHDLGFNFTGFEIDSDYFRSSLERLTVHVRQKLLFR